MPQELHEPVDIIVVDDRDNWRNIIVESLNPLSYSILSIANFEEAKFAIKFRPFKLAILDLNMHDADEESREGWELLAIIDQYRIAGKVLIVTGFGSENDEEIAAENKRVIGFIEKRDFDPAGLRTIVQDTIQSMEK